MASKTRFFDIVWDTDGQVVSELPAEVTLAVPAGVDAELEGADMLSDRYGWCVKSFSHAPATC